MKVVTLPQIVVIAENDPATFQTKVNKTLQDHLNITSIEYRSGARIYNAIITYKKTETTEETAEDYFKNKGKQYCCNDCPHLELDPDRRSITHYCSLHKDRVRLNKSACEDFLQGLKSKREHLVTTNERRAQYDKMDAEEIKRRKERAAATRAARYQKNQARNNKRQTAGAAEQIRDNRHLK